MERIALITDTTSDLKKQIIDKYDIKLLPFRIIYKNKEYKDRFEITPKQVYESLKKEVPTSSLPSNEDIEAVYESLINEGYTHAIVITLSSGLSGISNAVRLASENFPKIKSYVYDSKSISVGEGILVQACGELIKLGKSYEDIIRILPEMRKKFKLFFVVGTLDYLKKGGRIGKVSGTIGELLNIKPIISVDEEGKYFTHAKVRGRKQSLNRMVEIGKEILQEKPCNVYILDGDAKEDAMYIHDQLKKLNTAVSINYGGDISPVSGVHSGPGLVGVLFSEKQLW